MHDIVKKGLESLSSMKPATNTFVAEGSMMTSRAPLYGDVVSYLSAYLPNLSGFAENWSTAMNVHFLSIENVAIIFELEVNLRDVW